jgi:hypothetical protein
MLRNRLFIPFKRWTPGVSTGYAGGQAGSDEMLFGNGCKLLGCSADRWVGGALRRAGLAATLFAALFSGFRNIFISHQQR